MRLIRSVAGVALALLMAVATTDAQAPRLRIVVIAGEGGVNIIQQKTAIAPIVEVRDANDQPVAGATVKFSVQGGRATFSGAKTLTVTSDATGRAAGGGLTPTAAGAVQISTAASFQGLVATATIVQANFVTAAAAAAAGTAAVAGGAAAGGAAAGGGGILGMSATTLGIVGGAAAGGTIAAKKAFGGNGINIYEGEFRIDVVQSVLRYQPNGKLSLSCADTISFTGEVRGEIDDLEDGTVTGTVSANGYYNLLSSTCPPAAPGGNGTEKIPFGSGDVTGTTAAFQASGQTGNSDSTGTSVGTMAFVGALTDGVITGTFTIGPSTYKQNPSASGYLEQSFPATSTPVRLTR